MKEFLPLKRTLTLSFLAAELFFGGCSGDPLDIVKSEGRNGSKVIVCTTTMIHDIGKILAGDLHNVRGIMQPGEDPHIYELKPHDTILLIEADLILMNGLHLEAQVGHSSATAWQQAHRTNVWRSWELGKAARTPAV